ncbi:MAG: class I SAM-dependent methyltransferase [Ketobacteraceae bacterium]|nr:class I SAM-dependent methyltransferase [Ketobacteraceae bacterium]
MSNRTDLDLSQLYPYIFDHSVRESDLLQELRKETAKDEMARMQIAPEQGQFMALLVRLLGARRIVEVGTYTGYSSLAMASAMADDGTIVCCDISEEWTRVAKRYWDKAGVSHKMDLRLAPAADTLQALRAEFGDGSFDAAFIDADKENYDTYYEQCLALMRPGGLIMIDNVLWGGSVIDDSVQDEDTVAIRALNRKLKSDDRIDLSLIPIADGLTLARKRLPNEK